jgi:hypothetical protein
MLTISGHKGNANQNHTKIYLTSVRIAISRTQPTTSVDEDVWKRNPHSLLVETIWRLLKTLN